MMFSAFQTLRQARRDSNPRQKNSCRCHGGFAIHCATEAPAQVKDESFSCSRMVHKVNISSVEQSAWPKASFASFQ
ncbi:hypothetical protein PoB_004792600 [Plakobranchus ocellatus]|uniref:Uncharacterized protein n=1 Tax=Plakobranchus ocellatus TaxID=259542 RepID=A0AAV4BQT4_9GAST|nr:hypothetical protein PoB_004792600 [Plakobranchus ocellatus]